MSQRAHHSAPERHARCRLAQLISAQPFLRGSLVERARSCGKPTCRCQQGQLHRCLSLATWHQGQRALLYVPRALEETVRLWVRNGRCLSQQLQDLHQLQLDQPLRVVHTVETVRRRERVAGQWQQNEETSVWYWATTLTRRQLSTRQLWQAGHRRPDAENDCFNTLSTHWGLDHCDKHAPAAIVNFVLTLLLVYVLLSCFWQRNVKEPLREAMGTLLNLAEELRRSLGSGARTPWCKQWAGAP
jgi:hypothetical protein